MRIFSLSLLLIVALAGCEQAARYPAVPPPPAAPAPKAKEALPAIWSWMAPSGEPLHDAPLEFVPSSSPRWASLPKFWNPDPLPGAGMPTIHLGRAPLDAVIAMAAAEQMQVYRIKVPAGLPDPAPLIPECNPPTYAKWRLGRHLFFAPLLRSGDNTLACRPLPPARPRLQRRADDQLPRRIQHAEPHQRRL